MTARPGLAALTGALLLACPAIAPADEPQVPPGVPVLNPYAPPAARGVTSPLPLGGGNATESSARARVGDETDTFDLLPRGAETEALHGDEHGPIFRGGATLRAGVARPPLAGVHVVRPGDTLWDLSTTYFQNPYAWPRLWSYNPEIRDPHWIYPGDRVRLRPSAEEEATPPSAAPIAPEGARAPPAGPLGPVIVLADEGYLDKAADEDWGEIAGAPEDKSLLAAFDTAYVQIRAESARSIRPGQELTIFRPLREVPGGTIVAIQGAARVEAYDPRDRTARVRITASNDVIERGARVGPLARRFDVVAPVPNATDVEGHVVASVRPQTLHATHQVIILDRGADQGLAPGNRLFVIRRGDAWRRTLVARHVGDRIATSPDPLPDREGTPGGAPFMEDVVAELRVLTVRRRSATCVITHAKVEIEAGDQAVARRGY